jgi:hypothetical protein
MLPAALALMVLTALVWTGFGFWRLVWEVTPTGAGDLQLRWTEVRDMFAGRDVYLSSSNATYPPATMTLLWPALHGSRFEVVRVLWAVLTIAALIAMARIAMRATAAPNRTERWVAALIPFAVYAASVATGNGQLTVLVVTCLLIAVPPLLREATGWPLATAILAFVLALSKPSLAAPFFWMVAFRRKRPVPAVAIAASYLLLTAVAGAAQPGGTIQLCRQFLSRIDYGSARAAAAVGHANLQTWLVTGGRGEWATAGSLIILGLLGLWTWRHRHDDSWLLMSIAAFVARVWTYHAAYDDVILVIPMFALFRLARRSATSRQRLVAKALLTAMLATAVVPTGPYRPAPHWVPLPSPSLNEAIGVLQLLTWAAAFLFLLSHKMRYHILATTDRREG